MKWLIGAVVLLVLSGIVWEAFALAPSARASSNLEAMPIQQAQKGTFVVTLSEIGEISTPRSTNIVAPFDGSLFFLHDEGVVSKGDLLVQFDTQQFEDQMSDRKTALDLAKDQYDNKVKSAEYNRLQVENQLADAKDRVNSAQTALDQAQKDDDREKVLVDKGIDPPINLEQKDIALQQAKFNLESSKRALEAAQKNQDTQLKVIALDLQSAKTNLDKQQRDYNEVRQKIEQSKIFAPTSGLVTLTSTWKRGSFGKWTKGDQVFNGAQILNFPDMSEIHSVMKVDEVDIDKVTTGQDAEVRMDALPGKVYHGKVVSKGAMAITQLETTRFGGFSIGGGAATDEGI